MTESLLRLPPSAKRRLEKSISPAGSLELRRMGVNLTPKEDAVLAYLALSDEREYEKMIRTSTAISGAIEQRITGLMAAGSEVVEGPSHSPAATRLKDFSIKILKGIPKWGTVRREALRSIFYGWRPIELQWTSDFTFEGRPYWGVSRAVARKPWHYGVTADGNLALTERPGEPIVYDGEFDFLRFLLCTAGSSESPYGEAWLQRIWLLYFLAKQFEKMSAQAMQRSLGIIKMVRKPGGAQLGQIPAPTGLDGDIRTVMEKLNSNNVLVESQSYALEVINNAELSDNIVATLDYFNTQIRIAIVGQNLTSEVKGGSFAAEQGHNEILEDFQKADAREEADWWNDGLLGHALTLNFGYVDEMDKPRWQSKLLSRPNLTATQTYYDMGGMIDGRRVADAFNVPAIFEPGEDDVILKKQAPPSLGLFGFGQEEEEEPEPRPRPSLPRPTTRTRFDDYRAIEAGQFLADYDKIRKQLTRTSQDDAAAADAKVQAAQKAAQSDVSSELERYYGGLARAFKRDNPDPKD